MSINQLILRGFVVVYFPIILLVVLSICSAYWISLEVFHVDNPEDFAGITGCVSPIVGWLWWSYKIVKWKCWAFTNIEENKFIDLYNKAVRIGLIWPTGHIFNKTEIWTKQDFEMWSQVKPAARVLFEVP